MNTTDNSINQLYYCEGDGIRIKLTSSLSSFSQNVYEGPPVLARCEVQQTVHGKSAQGRDTTEKGFVF